MKMTTTNNTAIATKEQKYTIRKNCNFNEEIKEEWVQWTTGDITKTSLNDLTKTQASKIIQKQTAVTGNNKVVNFTGISDYAAFDKNNTQHKHVLSLCIQNKWSKKSDKYGEIADLTILDRWLKSNKSPVNKPLKKMTKVELSKIINALNGMISKKY